VFAIFSSLNVSNNQKYKIFEYYQIFIAKYVNKGEKSIVRNGFIGTLEIIFNHL
jgi:hypothetical protein